MANPEMLMMADALSREKGLERTAVIEAIEAALAIATRKKLGDEDIDVRVKMNPVDGSFETFRVWTVVEDELQEFPQAELTLDEAREREPEIQIGDEIVEQIENVEFGRISIQAAKQVINQKVREAERRRVADEYTPRLGEVTTGTIKRMERGDYIIDLGGLEALLPRSRAIPQENLRTNDRVRVVIADIQIEGRGPALIVDRTRPELLIELFRIEVPEVAESMIDILGAARDPGVRAKIAVRSNDPRIDPVGACVGVKGARVHAVASEIHDERVDIIVWNENPAQFVINALQPAEISSIVIDEESGSMDVVVDEDNLSKAIGRGGQNVRLASQLTGWELNILTDEQAQQKVEDELRATCQRLMELLDLEEDLAMILAEEGYTTIEEIAYVPKAELLEVDGLDDELVDALRQRAQDALITQAIATAEAVSLAEPAADLLEVDGVDEMLAKTLASKGIVTRDDLAEYAVDELVETLPEMDEQTAATLIMNARAHWFA